MSNFKSWVLTDVENDQYVDAWNISSQDLGIGTETPWSIRKRTLRGGLRDGVDVIEVDNGDLRYTIVPTRGMGIWRGEYHGIELGWQSPLRGPVHPGFVNQLELSGIGWLAGFDEWIVRCGLSSNGAPGTDVLRDNQGNLQEMTLTLHGRIANLPAHYVEVRVDLEPPHRIEVIGHVDEAMLFFPQLRLSTTISTTPGAASMTIADTVTNRRSQPAELELLYHCNFGRPLLSERSQFVAPVKMVAPREPAAIEHIDHFGSYPPPTPGFIENAYWFELHADPSTDRTLAMLVNEPEHKACALRFAKQSLPWFTLWKNPGAESDAYVTGLEPATNLPNLKTFEREKGRVIELAPGASHEVELVVEVADTAEAVQALSGEIDRLQQQGPPTVHRAVHPDYSP